MIYMLLRIFAYYKSRQELLANLLKHTFVLQQLSGETVMKRVYMQPSCTVAQFHYRSLSYAWYRCRLSFTLLRLLSSKGGCASTLCTNLPSATSAFWHFYNQ